MANSNPKTDHLVPTQWQPGQSGNPGGRPPYKGSITELIREALKKYKLCNKPLPEGCTAAHVLAETMIQHAIKGNSPYMKEIMDRNDGKVPDAVPTPELSMEEVSKRMREKRSKRKKADSNGNP